MQTKQSGTQIAKLAVIVASISAVSSVLSGCNPDEKPSRMVEMRNQMMKQREDMKNKGMGGQAPGAPAATPPATN